MRKSIAATAVVAILAAGGGGWYVMQHRDPLQQGRMLIAKGDYRTAGISLRSAVRENPDNAEAHALLAHAHLENGDPAAAEHEILRANALGWNRADGLDVLGRAYAGQRKWDDILRDIPEAGADAAESARHLVTRAVALRGLGKAEESNKLVAQAESLAPQDADVHLEAARFATVDGRADQAMEEVDRSIAIAPKRADALQLKAHLLLGKGDREGALAELTKAVDADPKRAETLVDRAALNLTMQRDADARADVDKALALDKGSVAGRYVDAVLLIRQGKFAEADVQLQSIDQVIDRLQRGLYFKAMTKSQLGLTGQAEDAIMSYVGRAPRDPDGARLLAQIELATKHPARAIPHLQNIVAAGQRDSQTLDLLGRLYAANGDAREAEATLQQASAAAKDTRDLARTASARLETGDLSGAATDLERSLQAAPSQQGTAEALVATTIRLGQLDRAQAALDAMRKQSGDTESVGILTGALALARMDPQAALAAFQDTARRFPDSTVARMDEAKTLIRLDREADALQPLKAVLDKEPTQPEALSLYAQILLRQNRGEEAVAAAEKARQAAPKNLGLVNGEAQIYGRLKQYDKALAVLDTAREGGRMPVPLLATLASTQAAAGKDEAAKRSMAELVAADPGNVQAVTADADMLARLKDFAGARDVLDAAIARQPQDLALMQARVRVDLLDGGVGKATATADRLASDNAHMPAAATLKGGVLMGAQRPADAAAAFRDAFAKDQTSAIAVALAQATNAAGDPAGAIKTLKAWQSKHPDDLPTAQTLGVLEIAAKDYDASERDFAIALKGQPNDVVALNDMAWLLQRKGDRRAQEYAQRAFDQSQTPEIADTLGWILAQQGEAAKALPLLRSAAAGAPGNPTIRYHLASALSEAGQKDQAIELLDGVVADKAASDERADAAALLAKLKTQKGQ